MTRKKNIETNQNHPLNSTKPKGPMILGRITYIDKFIKKVESQASVGPRTIPTQSPTTLPQAAASPSVAYAEIQYEIEGSKQSLQTAIHIGIDPSKEGGPYNLQEGGGEISGGIHIEISEPKSPKEVIET